MSQQGLFHGQAMCIAGEGVGGADDPVAGNDDTTRVAMDGLPNGLCRHGGGNAVSDVAIGGGVPIRYGKQKVPHAELERCALKMEWGKCSGRPT